MEEIIVIIWKGDSKRGNGIAVYKDGKVWRGERPYFSDYILSVDNGEIRDNSNNIIATFKDGVVYTTNNIIGRYSDGFVYQGNYSSKTIANIDNSINDNLETLYFGSDDFSSKKKACAAAAVLIELLNF